MATAAELGACALLFCKAELCFIGTFIGVLATHGCITVRSSLHNLRALRAHAVAVFMSLRLCSSPCLDRLLQHCITDSSTRVLASTSSVSVISVCRHILVCMHSLHMR